MKESEREGGRGEEGERKGKERGGRGGRERRRGRDGGEGGALSEYGNIPTLPLGSCLNLLDWPTRWKSLWGSW